MKSFQYTILSLATLFIAALWSPPNNAAGLMVPTESDLPQLVIKEHHVDVVIEFVKGFVAGDGHQVEEIDRIKRVHAGLIDTVALEPVETRSSVDRAVATTGDLITFSVTVDYESTLEVRIPEPGSEIAGFRIVDIGREEPLDNRGRIVENNFAAQ